ncbi:MAG TPA: nitroreductase family protein [Thermodesulfobacteriota bacterium]|jgi:hypothetical protein|nr:nitroreductase family protein [Thermodesulfobacteriota bacterium]
MELYGGTPCQPKKLNVSLLQSSAATNPAFAHVGFISQNVYLFYTSEGLATVVHLWFDKIALEKKMGLRPEQYITLVQSVGYPRKT